MCNYVAKMAVRWVVGLHVGSIIGLNDGFAVGCQNNICMYLFVYLCITVTFVGLKVGLFVRFVVGFVFS